MSSFFNILKGAGTGTTTATSNASPKHKKEDQAPELTPLEKILLNAGPVRPDGSDKFFGLENFGNTCYCNSIVQALYYSESFRHNVVNYPPPCPSVATDEKPAKKVNVTIRPPITANGSANGTNGTNTNKNQKGQLTSQALKPRPSINLASPGPPGQQGIRPEDKPDSPEYKKKQAMIKGPVLELAQEHGDAYDMQECTFTGLKDIFTALIESETRTGVLSPQRFLEIFKRDNEMFRNSMHQDAHEFYGLVLNDVISTVEANARRIQEMEENARKEGNAVQSVVNALGASTLAAQNLASPAARLPGTGWVHDIFEGVLTSETKCLTCETASQRDETFLDLSIDLEEHSSVTSCLRKFSAEEMLCERNKFHCDHCGGLQEAEKRMKIKRLPKVLALHLKRFKYTEDYSRLQKLFHRVVYPYHLRMFNTTDDADDPDRMYELYAVVVHIGGNAYHGHYVSVIKTQDRGWLLFDDEMVEPVDKHFVRNFFGDKPGMACAYVLFYQETTFEKVREEHEAEGLEEVKLASQKADLALGDGQTNGVATIPLSRLNSQPAPAHEDHDPLALDRARTAPGQVPTGPHGDVPPVPPIQPVATPKTNEAAPLSPKSKEEREREKKELKAQEKLRKVAEKEQAKLEAKQRLERQERAREARKNESEQLQRALQESKQLAAEEEKKRKKEAALDGAVTNGNHSPGFFNKANRGSRTMARKSFAFLNKTDKSEKSEKSERSEKSDAGDRSDRSDRGDNSAVIDETQQNGHAASLPPDAHETDKPGRPLKERFSFGLGKKKSEKISP